MLARLLLGVLLFSWLGAQVNAECAPTRSICRQLGYNMSVVPNYLGHRTARDALRGLTQLRPLVKARCSNNTAYFFCSLFFPMCTTLQQIIPPCQSLCLSVMKGCEPVLNRLRYNWPTLLNCGQFPKVGDGKPCIFRNVSSSSQLVNPSWPHDKPNRRPSLKKRQKSCWESKDHVDKQCCRQGNRAVKKVRDCALKISKKTSKKKKHFLQKAKKLCSANKTRKGCYQVCCQQKKKQLKNKRKRTRHTKRRKT